MLLYSVFLEMEISIETRSLTILTRRFSTWTNKKQKLNSLRYSFDDDGLVDLHFRPMSMQIIKLLGQNSLRSFMDCLPMMKRIYWRWILIQEWSLIICTQEIR